MEVYTGCLGEAISNFSVCVCVCKYVCNSRYDNGVCTGRMGELYHFIQALCATVNIRDNDIDFKVLQLQMSVLLYLTLLWI